MANFPTHIAVGTVVSGTLAVITMAADVVNPENLVAVTLAGVVGSVLPDIDLKESRPSKAMFSGLAVFFSFVVLFVCAGRYSIAEMLVMWLGTLFAVRFGAHWVFHRISYHRGIWHSFLAMALCSLFTAAVFYHALGRHEGVAWLGAGFMAIGFLTHLILDEMYSVDVMDVRIKSSFGTAMKFVDTKHWGHTAAMAVTVALVYSITPPTRTFVDGVSSGNLWAGLQKKMLPENRERWFGVDWAGLAARPGWSTAFRRAGVPAAAPAIVVDTAPAGSNPIATGSLPAPAAPTPDKPAP